jgi:hypothetical protein
MTNWSNLKLGAAMKRWSVGLLSVLFVTACDLDLTDLNVACNFDADVADWTGVTGADRVRVIAGAGDLRVRGRPGLSEVRVRGHACAEDRFDLDQIDLDLQRVGSTVRLLSLVPAGRSVGARLDLTVEVPDWMLVEIDHESGDVEVEAVSGVAVIDDSGWIRIEDIFGDVYVEDGSGDIEAFDVLGDFTVAFDRSGTIRYRNVSGRVSVPR